MTEFQPYTQAEKDQFVADLNTSRARHCKLVDHLISMIVNGHVSATSTQAGDEVTAAVQELYTLNNAKAPWGVRPPVEETPSLDFRMEVKK